MSTEVKTNKRILALDILRGITIAGMITVNNPGSWSHIYAPLRHAEWNGLTPTDLVFPFFMFIMGISTYISLKKFNFEFSRSAAMKILKRTTIIFLIGIAIELVAGLSFENLRIMGVMQRLALCYGVTSIVALTVKHRHIPFLIATLLIAYFVLLMCGNGFAYNETNILSVVDRAVLTPAHMYKDNGIEPEGLLSTIPSIAHVLIGFCVGRMMLNTKKNQSREELLNSHLINLFLVGAILTFSGFLLSYGCPLNKKVWSPTFVLTTCGLASSFLALLIWIIDVRGYKKWCTFFESFGVNPLFLYVLGAVLSILFTSITVPYSGGSISIQGFVYSVVLMPIFGETAGSLAYALLFVTLNWCIGYQLYKRKIYVKI